MAEPGNWIVIWSQDEIFIGIYQIYQILDNGNMTLFTMADPDSLILLEKIGDGYKVHGSDNEYIFQYVKKVDKAGELQIIGEGSVAQQQQRSHEDRYISAIINGDIILHGIFDGHGGDRVVNLIKENFANYLGDVLAGVDMSDENLAKNAIQAALDGFEKDVLIKKMDLEQGFANKVESWNKRSGSTSTFVLIGPDWIYVVNLGDSITILLDENGNILYETTDFDAKNADEIKRIEKAGGYVFRNRVYGTLTVSRALGDFSYKVVNDNYSNRGPVSLEADIVRLNRSAVKYVLLASDGIVERAKNIYPEFVSKEEIINYLLINRTGPVESEANLLLNMALTNESTDDITVILAKV